MNHLQVRDVPKSKRMKVHKKQKKKDTIEESREEVVAQLEHKVVYEVC